MRSAVFIDGPSAAVMAKGLGFDLDFSKFRDQIKQRVPNAKLRYYTHIYTGPGAVVLKPLLTFLEYEGYNVTSRETTDADRTTRTLKGGVDVDLVIDFMNVLNSGVGTLVLLSANPFFVPILEEAGRVSAHVVLIGTDKISGGVPKSLRRLADEFVEMDDIKLEIARSV